MATRIRTALRIRAFHAGRRHRVRGALPALDDPEWVLTHDQLLERVWSPGRKGESWLIRNVVKKQRRELSDAADNPA